MAIDTSIQNSPDFAQLSFPASCAEIAANFRAQSNNILPQGATPEEVVSMAPSQNEAVGTTQAMSSTQLADAVDATNAYLDKNGDALMQFSEEERRSKCANLARKIAEKCGATDIEAGAKQILKDPTVSGRMNNIFRPS